MKDNMKFTCIDCNVKACNKKCSDNWPVFCPTAHEGSDTILSEALQLYNDETNHNIMISAAEVEYQYYGKMTRIEETIAFAKKMNYKKIGIATCIGLLDESTILANILRQHSFEVFGVSCKAGSVDKTSVGIRDECTKVGMKICNPINQALRLNEEKTDLNIVMGLCVGHDILFFKYSLAPTTTLVVKDRVTCHNSAAPLYTSNSYYSKLMKPED